MPRPLSAYIMHNYISPILLILPRIPHILLGLFEHALTTLKISCFFPYFMVIFLPKACPYSAQKGDRGGT